MSENKKNIFHFLIFLGIAWSLFWAWVQVVGPFPDRDSVHQLYFPFLNSLVLGEEISFNPLFLKAALMEAYPWGLALLSSLLSALGLSQMFLNQPWFLPALFVVPIVLIPMVLAKDLSTRFLIFTGIWFFPVTQIALRSFSLHGLITALAISGLICFFYWMKTKSRPSLGVALCLLCYGASLKHLGAFIGVNLIFVFLIWKFLRRESLLKPLLYSLILIALVLVFYPMQGITVYSRVAFSHNPLLAPLPFTLFILFGLSLVALILILVRKKTRSQSLPNLFCSGRWLVYLSLISLWSVSIGAEGLSIPVMSLSFLLGYTLLIGLLVRYDFSSSRGFLYLLTLVSMIHGLILYFSFLGQVFAAFFIPLSLAFLLTVLEQKRQGARVFLVILTGLASNFFPGVKTTEHLFWEYGHHFFTRGLNGLHQNLLGWGDSQLLKTRNAMSRVLARTDFSKQSDTLPLLFSGLHPHTRLQFLFPENLIHPFPALVLLEHLGEDRLEKLRKAVLDKGLLAMREEDFSRQLPVLIRERVPWTDYPGFRFTCEDLSARLDSEPLDAMAQRLNDCYFSRLQDSGVLHQVYRRVSLPSGSARIDLFLHRSLKIRGEPEDRIRVRLEDFKHQKKWFDRLSPIEKISFQGVSRSERAAEFFRFANDEMEAKNWLAAYNYLKTGLGLEPNHKEMLIDMEIVERKLKGDSSPVPPSPDRAAELFKMANDEMQNKNWEKARVLLLEALELEPGHKEMLLDLGIVDKHLEEQE